LAGEAVRELAPLNEKGKEDLPEVVALALAERIYRIAEHYRHVRSEREAGRMVL